MLTTAYEKLFSREGFVPTNVDHVFAAFAVRAGLEIGQGEASERLTIQAVGSHMRILKSVVGSLANTISPSEPMLALAAAKGLNVSEEAYRLAIQTLLDELILKGLVLDRGLLGELSTRILLLRARDKASTSVSGDKRWFKFDEASGVPSVRAVRLSKFLQTTLGENLCIYGEKVLRATSYSMIPPTSGSISPTLFICLYQSTRLHHPCYSRRGPPASLFNVCPINL